MPLSADQRSFLAEVGLPSDSISALNSLGDAGKAAENEGRDRKEAAGEPQAEQPPQDEKSTLTREDVQAVVMTAFGQFGPIFADAIKALHAEIATLQAQVKELTVDNQQKAAEKRELTPVSSSYGDAASAMLFGTSARVPSGDPITQQKPKEAEANQLPVVTGSDYLDGIISRSYDPVGSR